MVIIVVFIQTEKRRSIAALLCLYGHHLPIVFPPLAATALSNIAASSPAARLNSAQPALGSITFACIQTY